MPHTSSYRLRLANISIDGKTVLSPHLQLDLVKQLDTNYINFEISSRSMLLDAADETKLLDFVKLITKQEYVSLTFNTISYDAFKHKLFFQPLMLPNLVYEFEYVDEKPPFSSLLEELVECEKMLDGFLTLKDLNEHYHPELERENCLSDSFETSMIEG